MIPVARLSDQHSCPIPGHGVTPVASSSPDTIFNMLGAARVGDVCGCGAVITVGFPSVAVNYRPLAHLGSPTSHGGSIMGEPQNSEKIVR
ncbi:PAAR domain-containing protein [Pseudomonas sp. OA3]|nr:PAAR domain-containing protein [Pseudomonas sp. OA3]